MRDFRYRLAFFSVESIYVSVVLGSGLALGSLSVLVSCWVLSNLATSNACLS